VERVYIGRRRAGADFSLQGGTAERDWPCQELAAEWISVYMYVYVAVIECYGRQKLFEFCDID
jgi:hypothetical protein